jgi:hypothetical protein
MTKGNDSGSPSKPSVYLPLFMRNTFPLFVCLFSIALLTGCKTDHGNFLSSRNHVPPLHVEEKSRLIQQEDGTPFLWLGDTAWGMTEWLSREEVDVYLDDRKDKGMNVIQLCLFWGKRQEKPTRFTTNPENFYGHKAFVEVDGFPDANQPNITNGISRAQLNDYWDHVDYCLEAIRERGMYAAVLPFWGRRYVNATHTGHSDAVFTSSNIRNYGEFIGRQYGDRSDIIWVSGGDVKADQGGDFVSLYRKFAEGFAKGISGIG